MPCALQWDHLPRENWLQDQTVYWREASNGLATLPYFLGSSFVDLYYIILAPLIFVGAYWHLTLPASSIPIYYLASLAAVWWSSGVAYAISGLLPSGSTLIATVFLCMVVGAFLSGTQPTIAETRDGLMGWVLSVSYTRCASLLFVCLENWLKALAALCFA